MIVNPGIRRFLGSAIQRLFNSASFYAPLTHTLALERGTGSPTFTRATTATVQNNDGYLVTALSGEARFEGARRVRNLLSATEDFSNAAWSKTAAGAGSVPTVTSGFTDPDGGSTAWRLQCDSGGTTGGDLSILRQLKTVSGALHSIYIKSNTGATQSLYFGTVAANNNITVTTAWQRLSVSNASTTVFDLGAYPGGGVGATSQVIDVLIWHPQLEDVTAQTTQTAGEYVSVGVESAPYYHGSMVDGVKCFPTDLSGNPIPAATMLGYQAEVARTNLCLQSNAFNTTWLDSTTPAATQNVVGPDGATSAWTIADDDATNLEFKYQPILLTAAAYTASVFVKKTVGTQASYPVFRLSLQAGGASANCTIDTTNGIATAWTAFTGDAMLAGISASCSNYNDDFWRVSLTATATAANYVIILAPAATTNPVQSTGAWVGTVTGSAVFYGAQLELGSFASSYIPTTTVAVTRNADVLTYSSAGNIDGTKGWCYAEVAFRTDSAGYYIADSAANRVVMYGIGTGVIQSYDGTNNPEYAGITLTNGTVNKLGTSWSAATSRSAMAKDGTLSSTNATFDGDYNFGASIGIGTSNGGVNQPGIPIRNVRIGQRQLSASELQAITS